MATENVRGKRVVKDMMEQETNGFTHPQKIAVSTKEAAELIGVNPRHFATMEKTGRINKE